MRCVVVIKNGTPCKRQAFIDNVCMQHYLCETKMYHRRKEQAKVYAL